MAGTESAGTLRFGVVTDVHLSTERGQGGEANQAAADLKALIDSFRKESVDFILQLGDLISGTSNHDLEELHLALSILNAFPGTVRHVVGNHCLSLPRATLLLSLGLGESYYAFSLKGVRFIVLDGMDVSVLREPETAEDRALIEAYQTHPEIHDYCGGVGERQKAWLKEELLRAETVGEAVIVVCHFPLMPETTDEKHGLLWNHREISKLIASSPAVIACLGGHYHYGGHQMQGGAHFVVLPAFVNRHEHPDFSGGTVELTCGRIRISNQQGELFLDLPLNRKE
ncbi:MAG: metallophosphoesterase [Chlorobiaceae bacterium]